MGNVFFDVSNANFTISTSGSSLSINDVTVGEGNAGTSTATFIVTLSPTNASAVTVAYATADGTASAGSDYASTSGTLTFAAGESTRTISVVVSGDATNETDEAFFVNLSGAVNATIADGQGLGTVANDDGSVSTSGVVDGTFEAGSPWPAWTVQTSTNFGTPVCNASVCPTNGGITPPYAGANWAWFGGIDAGETATLGQTLTFPLSSNLMLRFQMRVPQITGSSTETLVISVDGTPVQTFVEPPSTESAYSLREVDVTPFADGGNHALLFRYDNVVPLNSYASFLVDNVELFSYPPSLSVDDVAVTEGDSGTTTASFTVRLSPPRSSTVTVAYATANGTATAGSDYVSTSGTLIFAPGESTKSVPVVVNGDAMSETNESLFVSLSGATNATITDNQGAGTIINDECASSPPLATGLADGTFEAGNPWPAWTVQTSTNFGTPLCDTALCGGGPPFAGANWAWFGGAAAVETATLGQTVTFPLSSSLTLRFQMQVLGTAPPTDTLVVSVDGIPVKTFSEPMSSELAYSLRQIDLTPFANGGSRTLQFAYNGPTTGVGSFFVDNVEMLHCPPPAPSISIEDVVVSEGNSGIRTATFMVTLSAATAQTVTVAYATGNGTATGGSDYISASGTLTFAPGTTTRPISVTINGDTLDEANETFFVNLSSPTNATLSDAQGAGAIEDDDPPPSLSINDVTATEGNTGSTNATFTVTLSTASGQQVTVAYETADGTATAGLDYTASAGTLTFAPGATTQSIAVSVSGDALDEPNEVFFLNLGSPVNALVGDGHGTGTIADDDPLP